MYDDDDHISEMPEIVLMDDRAPRLAEHDFRQEREERRRRDMERVLAVLAVLAMDLDDEDVEEAPRALH